MQVLRKSLGFEDGDQWQISDFADIPTRGSKGRPEPIDKRFPKKLQEFLHEWSTTGAPRNYEQVTAEADHGEPWLSTEDFGALTRYLRDALCAGNTFEDISQQLLKVVSLKLRDESAKRRARRKYIGIMMNDFVTNPGVSNENIGEVEGSEEAKEKYGLMGPFIERWESRLPDVLASGAGSEVHIPPGNQDLIDLLMEFGVDAIRDQKEAKSEPDA